jgi:transposase
MLQPLVRRTWGLCGQRPVMYCWDRHDRLSVIAGLTVAAQRRRLGLYFALHRRNIKTPEVEEFIRNVQRQVRKPLIIVMDRLAAHRSAAKRLADDARFEIEWLPAYAPELNPTEYAWSNTKYTELANYVPDDVLDLEIAATLALNKTRREQKLLRSFFAGAKLKP